MTTPDKLEARRDRKIFKRMVRRHKDALVSGPGDDEDDDD